MRNQTIALFVPCVLALGCGPTEPGHDDHDTEIISRVELTFTPIAGGDPRVFAFSDPDGDGGVSGSAEPIVLALGETYSLRVAFLNDLADPAVDITEEVEDEAEDHFVFVLGDGVAGPASPSSVSTALVSHAYADLESDYGANAIGDDLPLGIVSTIEATKAGTAGLRVVLRHLPELNGTPQKTAGLPESLAAGEALPGDVDVDVSFELTIQ
ncbi:hypothetical protein [Enhygromyxa salina]|nr:hypothetical protein [Enhygromyxa salina]